MSRLVHTLLFLFRENRLEEDAQMAASCLKSLENSTYKTVVLFNQGSLDSDRLREVLSPYALDFHILGDGSNTGTSIGRQKCFEYIWTHLPDTEYISEIHPDMVFPSGWEDPLINFLDEHDEPLICCGIIDRNGSMPFLQKIVPQFEKAKRNETFLNGLRSDEIVHGFTVPCIHVSKILKETGGYNPVFLKGKQCFEDDSMLLGYYYYYGTRANWYPKVCYRSVVYHAVAGQRISVTDDISVNLNGLFRQYGALGFLHLAGLHKSAWHQKFFTGQYNRFSSQ